MDPYTTALYKIVAVGQKTNSYKFALWRALASLAPSTDKRSPKISKDNLAPLFLEYYWPLELKYHIRQSIDPARDPIVMVRIRQLLKDGIIKQGESLKDSKRKSQRPTQRSVIGSDGEHSTMSSRAFISSMANQLLQ